MNSEDLQKINDVMEGRIKPDIITELEKRDISLDEESFKKEENIIESKVQLSNLEDVPRETNVENENNITEKSLDDVLLEIENEYEVKSDITNNTEISNIPNQDQGSSLTDIDSIIKEKTGGKFSSWDELQLSINNQVNTEFASDRIKKLNDLEKQGVDILRVLEYDKLNIESLNPQDFNEAISIIKAKLKIEDPEITDRELNFILRDYSFNDDTDQDEVELKKIKALRDAKKYKNELIEYKKQLEIPKNNPVSSNNQQQDQELRELQSKWTKMVSDYASKYTIENINVGEADNIKYIVKEDAKHSITKTLNNPSSFWTRYTNQDGKTDMDRLFKDMLLIENKDAVLKTIYDQGKAIGAKSAILKIKNARSSKGEVLSKKEHVSYEKQIHDQLKNMNF